MSFSIKYEHRQHDIYSWNNANRRQLEYRTPHLHRELELVIYMGGKTAVYVDSVRYDLQPGDLFLTFPNQIHSYETLESETFHLFLVKPELMPELADVFNLSVPTCAVVQGGGNDPKIQVLWRALADICSAPDTMPYRKPLLHGYLLALFSEILSRMTVTGIRVEDSDALRSIVSYCSKNYDKDLSLSSLEEALHLNKYYISHLFSGKLGMRFNDYINSLRVSEACRCLLHTDESITAISDRVGFNTLRTFNRSFIKQLGVSPSDYRRNRASREASVSTPPILPDNSFECC